MAKCAAKYTRNIWQIVLEQKQEVIESQEGGAGPKGDSSDQNKLY